MTGATNGSGTANLSGAFESAVVKVFSLIFFCKTPQLNGTNLGKDDAWEDVIHKYCLEL